MWRLGKDGAALVRAGDQVQSHILLWDVLLCSVLQCPGHGKSFVGGGEQKGLLGIYLWDSTSMLWVATSTLHMRWVTATVPPQKWSQVIRTVSRQEPGIRSHCCPQGLQQGEAIQGL